MKICDAAQSLGLKALCCPSPDTEVTGGYTGDLLSWVMGRAQAGQIWVTIMSNINIVAVASLVGAAAIVLAEDCVVDEKIIETAEVRGVNIFTTPMSSFEASAAVSKLLEK